MTSSRLARDPGQARGRLRIGDDWNAITIIALSQSNPLKAIAELVENSIDAKARAVTLTRGRQGAGHWRTLFPTSADTSCSNIRFVAAPNKSAAILSNRGARQSF